MNAEDTAASLAAGYEGYRQHAYQDSGGIWTVGYGTIRLGGRPVVQGDSLSPEEALRLLKERIAQDSKAVRKAAGKASENQVAALLSLAYNVGLQGVLTSTALRSHLAGDRCAAARGILMWDKVGAASLPGLLRRRCGEAELYLTP